MEYSTLKPWQEISETGIVYTLGSLYGRFQGMTDPRKKKGKQYSLLTLLTIIFLAKLSGKDNPVEIADWAKNEADELSSLLRLKSARMPHDNTYRRVFQNILDKDEFEELMREYHEQETEADGEVLSMDRKALRGTCIPGQERCDYVLSVYDGATQQVKAQEVVETKENEITAAPRVLKQVELEGKIVTGDALHTQRAISEQILEARGHYLWPVKNNQPRLHSDIQHLFEPDQPKPGFGKIQTDFETAKQVSYGHGRIEIRTIQTSEMLNDYLDWPGVGQVYRLERQFFWVRRGDVYKTSDEIEYGITDLSRKQAPAIKVLKVRRSHWGIETGLHYRRDVTFHEDATRMTIGVAGSILSVVHNLVLGLLKRAGFTNSAKGRRWFDGHLADAFALLISLNSFS
jgi:predicted transposase YbfD/YdcC